LEHEKATLGAYLRVMAKKKIKGKIEIDRERCKGCQLCLEVCPSKVIGVDEALNKKGYYPARFKENLEEDEKGCTGCVQCATVCPEVAIEVYRAK
jgi:2-oxoglutarate ferredoxin oxidoreductase subunit delta